jgi:photosystem II stability/assembly factor-like uncharacterized protein
VKLSSMNRIAAIFGGLALLASAHAALPAPQTVAPPATGVVLGAKVDTQAEVKADAYTPSAVQEKRFVRLKNEMQRKLTRKPKHERDGVVTQWQTARGAMDGQVAFDQPQSAQTFFLEKRLAAGQRELSPALYEGALQQAAQMPVYSTFERRMLNTAAGAQRTLVPTVASRSSPAVTSAAVSGSAAASALSGPWEALGPGNIGGRTRALLIHPTTPNTMWSGAVAGGIWKTTDGGTTWTPKADLLINIAVNSMALDPRNPNTLYAGTGEGFFNGDAVRGAGILKSTDGGETWAQIPSTANTPDFHYVQKIVVTRGATQRIYAATRTGVFRSTDGGNTWGKVVDGSTVNGCMDLAVQSDRALPFVFASCGSFAQGTIYRALDSAAATQTWTPVLSTAGMGRTSLALAPSNQNIIYALSASIATGTFNNGLLAVYRSNTSGATGSWTTQVDNTSPVTINRLLLSNPVFAVLSQCGFGTGAFLNQGWYDNFIAVDPADPEIVWAGGIDAFRSNDGGRNWGQASHWWFTRGVDVEYAHADHHGVVFHPQYNGTSNKTMFNVSDGGIFVTTDARAPISQSPDPITPASPVCGNTPAPHLTWGEKNNGYRVTQFYHGAHYPDGNTFFGGTQDNGTVRGIAGSPDAWTTIRGGDGGYVAVVPTNTNILFAENTGLSLNRSTNGGTSYTTFTGGITENTGNFLFITPFVQDSSNASLMWIGGATPWRTNQATTVPAPASPWVQAGPFFGSRISAWGVSKLNNNRVYAGTGSGGGVANNCRVFTTGSGLTSTAATVWTSSKVRADACFISWVEPDPVLAGRVYATISTFNGPAPAVGHVFRSDDFGATWVSIDGSGATGIPDVPVHAIAVDPNDNQRLYLGTDIGVFVSLDGGANWARENTGFANVIVESLSIKNTAPRYLFAYTHGRSVYRVALP